MALQILKQAAQQSQETFGAKAAGLTLPAGKYTTTGERLNALNRYRQGYRSTKKALRFLTLLETGVCPVKFRTRLRIPVEYVDRGALTEQTSEVLIPASSIVGRLCDLPCAWIVATPDPTHWNLFLIPKNDAYARWEEAFLKGQVASRARHNDPPTDTAEED